MKKLFFTIALLVALNSAAQNRFTKAFQQADSAFTQQTDSILFARTIQEIEADTQKIITALIASASQIQPLVKLGEEHDLVLKSQTKKP